MARILNLRTVGRRDNQLAAESHMDHYNLSRVFDLYEEALRKDQGLPAWSYIMAADDVFERVDRYIERVLEKLRK